MRDINASALAAISAEFGLEAVNIVRIWWTDSNYTDYSDKREGLEVFGVQGKVLSISGLDNIISLDKTAASGSISVQLDDSDGSLRGVTNSLDLHKRPCQVLQWFTGRPLSDAFVLFSGRINTPMSWNEGDRTFDFTIVNEIENLELGFSLEEGLFSAIPATAYGKAFPMVFGTALRVPAMMLSESPAGITAQGFAWVFDDEYRNEINAILDSMAEAFRMAQFLYQAHIGTERLAASYRDGVDGPFSPPDDQSTYESLHQAAQQYYAQYVQYMDQFRTFQLQANAAQDEYDQKKAYARRQIVIASENFPRGVPCYVEINGNRFLVQFDGVVMNILDYIEPPNNAPEPRFFMRYDRTEVVQETQTSKSREKFRWYDAGSKIRVISIPLYYIACIGLNSTVVTVYARQKGVRVRVPNNLYTIQKVNFTNGLGHTVWANVVVVTQPLTTLYDLEANPLYESDDIWCDIISEVPGNFISIMLWTIMNFTTLTADAASFAAVAPHVVNNPMNFMILDRKNTLDFIKELCYQARVAVWVDNGVVKLRYLPIEPTPAETITPEDVLEGTLQITCDDTEEIITKTVAKWKGIYDLEQPNRIIVRYNVAKYGVQEEEYDYYAFQTGELVQRAATYWAIRRGNTWKRLNLKTHIGKLRLEAQDAVLLSGFNGMFSRNDVVGIVESCSFDSADNSVSLSVWLPIRWGEFDPYYFAYPANISAFAGQGVPEFRTGNPFEGVTNLGFEQAVRSTFWSVGPQPPLSSRPGRIDDQPPEVTFNTALSNVELIFGRPTGLEDANDRTDTTLLDPPAVTVETDVKGNADFGVITGASADGKNYAVQLVGSSNKIVARQYLIANGYRIPNDTPVVVIKKNGNWYMQSPVWALERTSDPDI